MTLCDLRSSYQTCPRAVLSDPELEFGVPKAFLNLSFLIYETKS